MPVGVPNLVNMKDAKIDLADEQLLDGFDEIENSIYNGVDAQLNQFEQKEGKVLFNDFNLLLVAGLAAYIINSIQNSNYPESVRRYLQNFDAVEDLNLKIHHYQSDIDLKKLLGVVDGLKSASVAQTTRDLTGTGVETEFIKPLTELIYRNVVSGASLTDLKKSVEEFIKGTEDKNGVFRKYVSRMSRDALYQYDGLLNSRIADAFGMDGFLYLGTLIQDSRPQCVRWVGMRLLAKKDMPAELRYAENYGSGLIPGTTADNFSIYRGGYNCRHTALPVKLTPELKARFGMK